MYQTAAKARTTPGKHIHIPATYCKSDFPQCPPYWPISTPSLRTTSLHLPLLQSGRYHLSCLQNNRHRVTSSTASFKARHCWPFTFRTPHNIRPVGLLFYGITFESSCGDTLSSDTRSMLVNLINFVKREKLKIHLTCQSQSQRLIDVIYPERDKGLAGSTPGEL